MYRILADSAEVRERRDQLRHPHYTKPELLATAPNQVWSWDITKLKGPAKWIYFYLYVILDIFSRYVVGWMLAQHESAGLAKRLIDETCAKQNIREGQLTIHADRGSSMSSKTVAEKLCRPWRRQDPQPAARLQRQSVLRDPVQDAQVPARLPRALRLPGARTRLSAQLLPLVQRRAPPQRALLPHPGRRPLRPRRPGPRRAAPRPHRRLHRAPRALRQRAAAVRKAPRGGLDQPAREHDAPGCPRIDATEPGRPRGRPASHHLCAHPPAPGADHAARKRPPESLNAAGDCLKIVDTFRLEDRDQTLRLSAAAALLLLDDVSALPVAEKALLHPDTNLSPELLHNLRAGIRLGVKDKAAVPTLTRLLSAGDVEARRAAVEALRNTNSPSAIAPLTKALEDADTDVQYVAVIGLAEITGQSEWRPGPDAVPGCDGGGSCAIVRQQAFTVDSTAVQPNFTISYSCSGVTVQ